MIVAHVSHPEDVRLLNDWQLREAVNRVATFDEAVSAACGGGGARIALTDLDAWPPGAARQVVRAYRQALERVPLVLRTGLDKRALAELPVLAELGDPALPVHVSFRSADALRDGFSKDDFQRPRTASLLILQPACSLAPADSLPTLVAVTVLAERLVSQARVASVVGGNKDKVEGDLAGCGFREFRELRALVLVAHALVRYQELGFSVAECAEAAGMDPKRFSGWVPKWLGASFTKLAGGGGYAEVIDRIVARLTEAEMARRRARGT